MIHCVLFVDVSRAIDALLWSLISEEGTFSFLFFLKKKTSKSAWKNLNYLNFVCLNLILNFNWFNLDSGLRSFSFKFSLNFKFHLFGLKALFLFLNFDFKFRFFNFNCRFHLLSRDSDFSFFSILFVYTTTRKSQTLLVIYYQLFFHFLQFQ